MSALRFRSIASNLFQYGVGGLGPHKRFCRFVGYADELPDRPFQFFYTGVGTALDLSLREKRKPSLHHIEPRTVSWNKVQMESGMFEQPAVNRRSLVRAIVV